MMQILCSLPRKSLLTPVLGAQRYGGSVAAGVTLVRHRNKLRPSVLCTIREPKWRLPPNGTLEMALLSGKECIEGKIRLFAKGTGEETGWSMTLLRWGYSGLGSHYPDAHCPPEERPASSGVHVHGPFLRAFQLCSKGGVRGISSL